MAPNADIAAKDHLWMGTNQERGRAVGLSSRGIAITWHTTSKKLQD
jgi:hypothetical protein